MNRFEIVSKYKDVKIPTRSTENSAGYDLCAAEDIVIPSIWMAISNLFDMVEERDMTLPVMTLTQSKGTLKSLGVSPVLVPTGVKIQLESNLYLSISARSSLPLNSGLVVSNAPGIIDADYYNNPDNEGEIFVQLYNFSPFDILLKKGDRIAQGVIVEYHRTADDISTQKRVSGLGSTGTN